mmetsp:Transcript_92052/g.205752  ORF Transcript_92052/g.205752 Transcript_92052/m.205752 type:complete len:251 (-) Transcript_92052:116-868(-)
MWIAGLFSAFLVKLTSSIDDIVWLAPFLTSNSSNVFIFQNTIVYTSVCLVQTIIATVIAYSGRAAVRLLTGGSKNAWSTEKILTVTAGCLLAVYSVKLLYEYIQECREGDGEEKGEPGPDSGRYWEAGFSEDEDVELINPVSNGIDRPSTPDGALDKADKERQQTLFVIAFIGSVDDLTLFVPMLVGKGFDLVQLVVGALVAAFVIVTLCIFIGLCKPIADLLSKIPLCLIVIVFAAVLLVKGFVFSDES